MRRVLLVAAVGVPLVALAITAKSGAVLDRTNFDATNKVSYISAAQCSGDDALHLEWNVVGLTGATFGQNDQFKIFASNTLPSPQQNGGTFCDEVPSSNGGTVQANQIGSLKPATVALADLDIANGGTAIKSATQIDCSVDANETKNVYICAHWYDAAGTTKKGWSFGTFQIQRLTPNAPNAVTVDEGDSRLLVSWPANGTTPVQTDHYVAWVFPAGQAPLPGTKPSAFPASIATATTTGDSATISKLQNGVSYDVVVVAYSVAGNPSGASPSAQGTPGPTANFWQVYHDRGGVEQGGCSSGAGGALALLGVASLLAFRRRKP